MVKQLEGLDRWVPLILQVVIGAIFIMHGSQKLFGVFGGIGVSGLSAYFQKIALNPSLFWAWVVTIVEFFGGACIFLGLLTRFWAAALVIDMIVAVAKVHFANGFFWGKAGWEMHLAFIGILLSLVLMGPAFLSIDRAMGLEKREA